MGNNSDLFGIESVYGKSNELHIDNLGLGANLNPWAANDSASRAQMFTSHLAQVPVIADPSIRRTLTGVEREYGRYTFQQRMPEDGRVEAIIDKYPANVTGSARRSPQKLVAYRTVDMLHPKAATFGVMDIQSYHIRHQYFGFMYKPKGQRMNMIRETEQIDAETVFATSPAIDANENYQMGVSSNMLYLSLHTTIEDGILARRKWLERFTATGIESRSDSWGNRRYPIGLYSSNGVFRAHPEIGQKIADHGLVWAIRDYDKLLAVVDMTPEALSKPDYVFDHLVYGKPGAEVIDITVYHDHNLDRINTEEKTPAGIDSQSRRYYEALKAQQSKIISLYEKLRKDHGERLVLRPSFQRLVVWAYGFTNHPSVQQPQSGRVNLTYRRAPIDDFRTELVFKYDIKPSVGSKLTTMHGGKGVVVEIREDEDMPRWPDGTIADLVMDNDSNIKRMNLGGLYEQATGAYNRQVTVMVRNVMNDLSISQEQRYRDAFAILMEYYSIASPHMHEYVKRRINRDDLIANHVAKVVADGIYLWLPPHTEGIGAEIARKLEMRYGLEMHPVTYRAANGELVTTKDPMLIAETYIIMLEKNGFDWSAVASPKRQHYGILARMTNMDKHSTPGRENAVRITGEAEIRLLLALLPDYVVADILDRPNNPAAHKAELRSIISAPNPAQIEMAVDRRKVPLGGNRAIQFIRHVMWCCGIVMRRKTKKNKRG